MQNQKRKISKRQKRKLKMKSENKEAEIRKVEKLIAEPVGCLRSVEKFALVSYLNDLKKSKEVKQT